MKTKQCIICGEKMYAKDLCLKHYSDKRYKDRKIKVNMIKGKIDNETATIREEEYYLRYRELVNRRNKRCYHNGGKQRGKTQVGRKSNRTERQRKVRLVFTKIRLNMVGSVETLKRDNEILKQEIEKLKMELQK